jgi:hypothetical protein
MLLSEHNGQNACGLGWVARIIRAKCECRVVIVDLPEKLSVADFKTAEVVFAPLDRYRP